MNTSPVGNASVRFASIGRTGGLTGRSTPHHLNPRSPSVLGRPFHVIDYKDIHGPLLPFQLQAQLVTESFDEGGARRSIGSSAIPRGRGIRLERHDEVVFPREA